MTITHQGSTGSPAASAQGTTSASRAFPAGVAAGRIAILTASVKLSTATFGTPTDSTGNPWFLIGELQGGTGASANDAGTTRVAAWYKILTGAETGSVTVSNTGGLSTATAMSIYSGTLGGWATPAFVAGADTTHGANWSATCGAWGATLAVDDLVIVANSTDTDTAQTITAPTITQTGATFGARTQRNASLSTSGTDSGCWSWDASVTAGTANAPTYTHTSATSACGATIIIRLREAAGATNVELVPSLLPFVAVALTPTPGVVSVSLTPSVLNLSAQSLDPDPGVVNVTLVPAVINFTAVELDPEISPSVVNLEPAVLNFSAQALDPDPGPVTTTLVPAGLTFSAQALDPDPGMVSVELVPAVMSLGGVALNPVPGVVTVTLVPAVLNFQAVALTVSGGAIAVELVPAVLALTGVPLTPVPGVVSVTLDPTVLSLSAMVLNPVAGPATVELVPAVINFVAMPLTFAAPPVEGDLDQMIYETASTIIECVYTAVSHDDPHAIARRGVVPGEIAWDNCQCGQLVIAEQRRFGSRNFPLDEIDHSAECGEPWTVSTLLLSLTRCIPTMDTNGNPPSIAALQAAAVQLADDMNKTRPAVMCCLQELYDANTLPAFELGAMEVVGPQGMCGGFEMTIFLGFTNDCGCS